MTKQMYTTRTGVTQYRPALTEQEYLHTHDDGVGFCLACGETADSGIEPDARNYRCEGCGARKVFGLEELLIMGLLVLQDGE